MKYFIGLFLCAAGLAFAGPDWMKVQIFDDLAGFMPDSLVLDEIEKTYELDMDGSLQFIKVVVFKNKVKLFQHTEKLRKDPRRKAIKECLKKMCKKKMLPNATMIFSIADGLNFETQFLVPIFVFAKTQRQDLEEKDNILIPDFESLLKQADLIAKCKKSAEQYPWEKKQNLIFWRGAMNGGLYDMECFRDRLRVKMVYFSKFNPNLADAAFVKRGAVSPEVAGLIASETFPFSKKVPRAKHFGYKYLIDIDGESCTYARCRWILLSNSVLLKPYSTNIQWYYKRLKPYYNYVPLAADLSDLPAQIHWLKTHDSEARLMAENATEMAGKIFSEPAIYDYISKAAIAYSQLFREEK